MRGQVENKTDRDWSEAVFQVSLYAPDGREIDPGEFSRKANIFFIKKGAAAPIGYGDGKGIMLSAADRRAIGRMDIAFIKGSYPVEYTFRLTKPTGSKGLTFREPER